MPKTLGLICTPDEKESYLAYFKPLVEDAKVYVYYGELTTLTQLRLWAEPRGITGFYCTRTDVLEKLLTQNGVNLGRKSPSQDDYQGSYFQWQNFDFVFLNPLEHLVKVNYAKFTFKRFVDKLLHPEHWPETPEFRWSLFDAATVDNVYSRFAAAKLLSVDSETTQTNIAITVVGYTALFLSADGTWHTETYVIPVKDDYSLEWVRTFNASPPAKVLQNGKYDCAYFARFGVPLHNYLFDTANAFHSWYCELPKDLGFLQAFFVRTAHFWKDLASTGDLQDYYLYCGKDTWATALAFVFWLCEAPDWAKKNYVMEFPLIFPSHLCEMRGIKRDMKALETARQEQENKLNVQQTELNTMLGVEFNTNSYKQKQQLLKVMGNADLLPKTDEKTLHKAAFTHPLNGRVFNRVIEIQKIRKLISTYLTVGEDKKEFNNRILYAINPHATDTGRNASKEHHFWCGLQIQNVPRGSAVKKTFIADEGFLFGECDLEQAESRDTAHISGCESLIAAVSSTRDFHSVNTAAFFGVPYELVYDDEKKKPKDKKLRDLAKRVNHGANYNMSAPVLIDTMGWEKIEEARKLLKLPKSWSYRNIADYLLAQFHKTYPEIQKVYYKSVVDNVIKTRMLIGATGWTRYCFGKPDKVKSDLNAYVAHCPQSLNAMKLNKAFLKVFYEVALHPEHSKNFKLLAQIHDSILFQYRKGHGYLCDLVKQCMEIPVTVTGADGKSRTYTVPAAIKTSTNATHWHLTED